MKKFLRDDRSLPDDALVVRGGTMKLADLRKTVVTCYELYGIWGISVQSAPEASVRELAADLRHPTIRVSTVRTLRGKGFQIWPSGSRQHHCSIVLGFSDDEEPSDGELERLAETFGEVQDRPQSADAAEQDQQDMT